MENIKPTYYVDVEIGDKFNELTVLAIVKGSKPTKYFYCECSCGEKKYIKAYNVYSSITKTCGNLSAHIPVSIRNTAHGDCYTKLYRIHNGMLNRCNNQNHPAYKYYGGKGIQVCESWKNYESFKAWAETANYKPGLTIDRLDSTKGYNPDNCEWVTKSENSRRRNTSNA